MHTREKQIHEWSLSNKHFLFQIQTNNMYLPGLMVTHIGIFLTECWRQVEKKVQATIFLYSVHTINQ